MFRTHQIKLTYIKDYILHFEEYSYKKLKTKITKRSRNINKTCFKFAWKPIDKIIYLVGIAESEKGKEIVFMEINMKEMEILRRFLCYCLDVEENQLNRGD